MVKKQVRIVISMEVKIMIKEFIKRNKKLVIIIGIVLVVVLIMVLAQSRNKGVKSNPPSEVAPQATPTEEPSITETPEVTDTPEPTLPPIPTDTPYPLPSDDLVNLDESDEGADTGGKELDIPDEDGVDEDGVFYQDGKWYDKDPYVDDSGEAPTGSDAKEYGEY